MLLARSYMKSYAASIKAMVGPKEWFEVDRESPLLQLYTIKICEVQKVEEICK